ncbi:MAG: HEAT repeat domain-containing protein [Chloroflexota bacterium]
MNEYYDVVDSLKFKEKRFEAGVILAGGVGATETRGIPIPPEKLEALIWGLKHPSSPVRWGVLEILDNHPGDEAVTYIVEALDDPVPRVRWHAVHALTCELCKDACKDGHSNLTSDIETRMRNIVANDPSPKVRGAAKYALGINS